MTITLQNDYAFASVPMEQLYLYTTLDDVEEEDEWEEEVTVVEEEEEEEEEDAQRPGVFRQESAMTWATISTKDSMLEAQDSLSDFSIISIDPALFYQKMGKSTKSINCDDDSLSTIDSSFLSEMKKCESTASTAGSWASNLLQEDMRKPTHPTDEGDVHSSVIKELRLRICNAKSSGRKANFRSANLPKKYVSGTHSAPGIKCQPRQSMEHKQGTQEGKWEGWRF